MQHDIFERRAEIEQEVILEGNSNVRDRFRHDIVSNTDLAGRLLEQTGNHQHQCALAATRGTDDRDEFSGSD
jgi:hypothetical protein